MRIYRAFVPDELKPGTAVPLDEGEARHLGSVRRTRPGEEVHLVNGRGRCARARLTAIEKKSATLEILAILQEEPAPMEIRLCCALTKSSDYDEMLTRAIELGMTTFQPLITERTVAEPDERRMAKKLERWNRLSAEAIKQCERLWLPRFLAPLSLKESLVEDAREARTSVFLVERREDVPALRALDPVTGGISVYIGPEGGWTPAEISLAEEKAKPASLSQRAILRTETAALAALATIPVT